MILKEAFRYQNYLSRLFVQATDYLSNTHFITTTTQNHCRSKANPDATNEEIIVPKEGKVDYTPNDLLNFVVKLMNEKQKLSDAITVSKKSLDIDIDATMSMNKMKQDFISVLRKMVSVKPTECNKEGVGYKFNNDGDQVLYRYPIKEVRTIDYDRNDAKALLNKYKKETDAASTARDKIDVLTEVDYIPIWEVDTPLEDILDTE